MKAPNTGSPDTIFVNPGSGQERKYGEDGQPEYDIDWDHDHGFGVPHASSSTIRFLALAATMVESTARGFVAFKSEVQQGTLSGVAAGQR